MKLIHMADLHLGKTVNEISMLDDQKEILQQILDILERTQADGLLIAGDVYDKSIPSEDAVNLFDWFLNALADRHVPAFVISGNHDSDDRLNFGSSLMTERGIFITGRYQGCIPHVALRDAWSDTCGPVNIYMLPFIKASVVAHYLAGEDEEKRKEISASYEAAVRAAIDAAEIDTKERNILVAHQFVTADGDDPQTSGSEMATLNVGTVEKISSAVFDVFDYTALGHIHRAQKAGSERVRYAGSPLCYSQREIGQQKSVTLVTLGEKASTKKVSGEEVSEEKSLREQASEEEAQKANCAYSYAELTCEQIPLVPPHPMIHLEGTFREILDAQNEENRNAYVYATLTDPDLVPDAMHTLLQYYPYAMKLDYAARTGEAETSSLPEDAGQMSFTDLMSAFFENATGAEPSQEQWEILNEAAFEAGISDGKD